VESEVRAVLRQHDVDRLEEVEAVVLETDGSMSVMRRTDTPAHAETLSGFSAPPSEQAPVH